MIYPTVDRESCGYCGTCVSVCPADAIDLIDLYLNVDGEKCTGCKTCVKVCPVGALEVKDSLSKDTKSNFRDYDLSRCKSLYYDVVVVGAGPGGSMSARSAAMQNVSVLMIEKRQEIGSPVRCAEGISKKPLADLVDINPKWICAEVNGGRIHSPDGSCVIVDQPGAGLVLERKIFDKDLSLLSAQAGAEIWTKSRAIDLIKENGNIAGVVIRRLDEDYAVRAKIVIGADGVESQIGRLAGIKTVCKLDDLDTCAQYLVTGIDIDQSYCDFYLGNQIAPRGYAWVFPKGKNTANVGVGIGRHIAKQKAIEYLDKFVEKELGGGSVIANVFGGVPICGTLSDIVLNGLMLVGDAAHQNDPVSGGGIINAMIAGNIAGEVAGKAIKAGDTSRSFLMEYEKRWNKRIGRTFRHLRGIREGVLKFNDNTLNDLARVLSQAPKLSLIEIFWSALKNEPRLLLELRHLVSMGWAQ
jgi:digeranylgeranylglycerophospholipid reductase